MKALIGGTLLLPDGELRGKAILFDDAIRGIVDEKDVVADEIIDANGLYISPGFVDVHMHGYLGEDVSDGSEAGVRVMAKGVLENGVTAFLPTTMTVPYDEIKTALEIVRKLMPESATPGFDGAEILGAHAEGPFINPSKKGAQSEQAILPPDAALILPYKDVVRIITLAPEMQGGAACIEALTENGIVCSIGHTGANYDQALTAIRAGADHITHTFNAMTPLMHRDPGVVGAALTQDVYAELIADTFHIHTGLFSLLAKVKGDKLVLITDCTRAGGLADGEYTLGGQPIFVKGIECRLADGTIAGSVLKMNDAVRNMRDYGHVPLYQAVRMASLNAAASIGADDRKGSLEVGKDADIILFDENVRVQQTIQRGVTKFERT